MTSRRITPPPPYPGNPTEVWSCPPPTPAQNEGSSRQRACNSDSRQVGSPSTSTNTASCNSSSRAPIAFSAQVSPQGRRRSQRHVRNSYVSRAAKIRRWRSEQFHIALTLVCFIGFCAVILLGIQFYLSASDVRVYEVEQRTQNRTPLDWFQGIWAGGLVSIRLTVCWGRNEFSGLCMRVAACHLVN